MKADLVHMSDSQPQRSAEVEILKALQKDLSTNLQSQTLKIGERAVQVDAIDEGQHILCEIYSRIGKLKGSQPDKLASDMLKMLWIEKTLGVSYKKYLCFASDASAATVRGNSWLAKACADFCIEIKVVKLSVEAEHAVVAAQNRQYMGGIQSNPPHSL